MADRKGSALGTAPSLASLLLYGWVGSTPYKVPATMFTPGTTVDNTLPPFYGRMA